MSPKTNSQRNLVTTFLVFLLVGFLLLILPDITLGYRFGPTYFSLEYPISELLGRYTASGYDPYGVAASWSNKIDDVCPPRVILILAYRYQVPKEKEHPPQVKTPLLNTGWTNTNEVVESTPWVSPEGEVEIEQEIVTLPTRITDLRAYPGSSVEKRIALQWTAPNLLGYKVESYIVKYSTHLIKDEETFDNADTYPQGWSPASPGETQSEFIFMNLLGGKKYYIAIKGKGSQGEEGELSNVVSQFPFWYVGYVRCSKANIRSGPRVDYKVIAHASFKEKIVVLQQKGKWFRIQIEEDKSGWVYGESITEDWKEILVIKEKKLVIKEKKEEKKWKDKILQMVKTGQHVPALKEVFSLIKDQNQKAKAVTEIVSTVWRGAIYADKDFSLVLMDLQEFFLGGEFSHRLYSAAKESIFKDIDSMTALFVYGKEMYTLLVIKDLAVKSALRCVSSVPPKYTRVYDLLLDLYTKYDQLYKLATEPSGSLMSYNNKVSLLNKEFGELAAKIEILMPE